ncbi:unnamed protein product [Gadus morhua 'NCC']
MAHVCGACVALLEPDDGHDRCPSCLGFEHLREGLTERACMNCGSMPLALRLARLAAVERPTAVDLPSMTPLPSAHVVGVEQCPPPRKRARNELASKVDRLTSDMVLDDDLSLAASANLLSEGVTEEVASNTFGEASRSSAQSSGHSIEGNPMGAVILMDSE